MENEEKRIAKNRAIKDRLKATRRRRKSQICRVFELKVVKSKLNAKQREALSRSFLEAKWAYNANLAYLNDDPEAFFKSTGSESRTVDGLDKDGKPVVRELNTISCQVMQGIKNQICNALHVLHVLKMKGIKVGRLQFKSEVNCLSFKQFGVTYKRISQNKWKLQGIPGHVRVRGGDQITDEMEIANAKLVRRASGYYLLVTTYTDKKNLKHRYGGADKPVIGVDAGCSTQFTMSDGTKLDQRFEETERLKWLQRQLRHHRKGSNGRWKAKLALRREYERIANRRKDAANKIVSDLVRSHSRVVIQDEQIASWQASGHGKAVSHGLLGRVYAKLKASPNVAVLDAWLPTTKVCMDCGHVWREGVPEKVRHLDCPTCGRSGDRDVFAAENMVKIWNLVASRHRGPERAIVKREEFEEAYWTAFGRPYTLPQALTPEAEVASARR